MKLIIDITEEKYNMIKNKMYCGIYDAEVYKAIANGTPFDKIRAEIEEIKTDTMYEYVGDFRYGVDTIIEILDKYRNEVSE